MSNWAGLRLKGGRGLKEGFKSGCNGGYWRLVTGFSSGAGGCKSLEDDGWQTEAVETELIVIPRGGGGGLQAQACNWDKGSSTDVTGVALKRKVPLLRRPKAAPSPPPDFQLMRLRARLESHFLIVGFTRVHTFVTWDSHELTHNLTGSHAQTDIPTKVDLLTPSLQHGDYGPGSTNNA